MTHELKNIVSAYEKTLKNGQKTVMATVVALDGSSYRRPGVRMLLLENGKMVGAVSGGCVEKEVFRQAASVFQTGMAKVMTYDGRYRLGCEGVLYILLEPFAPEASTLALFQETLQGRNTFTISSYYEKEHGESPQFGSCFHFGEVTAPFRSGFEPDAERMEFRQSLPPCFRLVIIGAEHDAVQLCALAAMTGWEVTVVAAPNEEKEIRDFVGATTFLNTDAENLQLQSDRQTALVLMTHSYVKDLQFLLALQHHQFAYMGVLGPTKRREQLFNELFERVPELDIDFVEAIHGPAGLDLGAETPQEIAVSIVAEILSVVNSKNGIPLKQKQGRIHA